MADLDELAKKILGGVRGYVERSLSPISARLKQLEDRPVPERGEKGEAGRDGERGLQGDKGMDGSPGIPGDRGSDGMAGERGERGEKGEAGLPGERGERGEAGQLGERGLQGERGEKGEAGAPGKDGAQGTSGERGQAGEPGQKGADGRNGDDGRDAAQIEVLDGINPAKSYQRGTFVAHRGGMVRARRSTDPLPEDGDLERAGWQVVLCGLAEVDVEFSDDLRTVKHVQRLTDGRVHTKSATFPVTIYRGVWKDGDDYTRGDSTTRDGSTWVLMTEKQAAAPGTADSGWLMHTKRGRDGRDGLRGEKGAAGQNGRDGKDMTQGPNF